MAKAGRKPGPLLKITDDQVKQLESMAAVGLNMDQMASLLGISKDTLERRSKEDASISAAIEKGRASALFQVGKTAYQQAITGKVPAMTMFYLKCRGGWKEAVDINAQIKSEVFFSDEQLKTMAKLILDESGS